MAEPVGTILVSALSTIHQPRLTQKIRHALGHPELDTALPLNNHAAFIELVFEQDHALPPMRKVQQ